MSNYSKREVEAAGDILIGRVPKKKINDDAIQILDWWRKIHKYPLYKIMHMLSDTICNKIQASFSLRLKRKESILNKLKRSSDKGNYINLRMVDDIAGCRLVFNDLSELREALELLKKDISWNNKEKIKDYISGDRGPQNSGYRGIHIIYKFPFIVEDRKIELKVELQLRTNLQHYWATCVEAHDLICERKIKFGQSDFKHDRLFKLLSQLIAIREKSQLIIEISDNYENIFNELKHDYEFDILSTKLRALTYSVFYIFDGNEPKDNNPCFYLLHYDKDSQIIFVRPYNFNDVDNAMDDYFYEEEQITEYSSFQNKDVLLAEADTFDSLKNIFPNYFSNIKIDEIFKYQ